MVAVGESEREVGLAATSSPELAATTFSAAAALPERYSGLGGRDRYARDVSVLDCFMTVVGRILGHELKALTVSGNDSPHDDGAIPSLDRVHEITSLAEGLDGG